jgi:hypothetical protein
MHISSRRQSIVGRDPFQRLWFTYRPKSTIIKSHKTGFLLAYTCQRHWVGYKDVWSLSKHFTTPSKTFGRNTTDTSNMATPKIGHQPCWPPATFARGEQICSRCSWILHKMDWGKTTSINHLWFSEEIFLAKHSMQIWSAKNSNSWQWQAVRFGQVQRVLHQHWDQASLRLSLPSRVQWSSRVSKQGSILCHIQKFV